MRSPDEEGFALIVSVIIAMVAILMVTLILAIGLHVNTATVRERRWQLALQVAESGVEDSITKLRTSLSYTGSSTPVDVAGGEFETTVTNVGQTKVILATGWVPSATSPSRIARQVEVTLSAAPAFNYALFSATSLYVKSGSGGIDGDIFANEGIVVSQTSDVFGDVISATGTVELEENAHIRKNGGVGGNVTSGGFSDALWAVKLAGTAGVEGDVSIKVAQGGDPCPSTKTGSPPAQAYNFSNAGSVAGKVYMPADAQVQFSGNLSAGQREARCDTRPAKEPLPSFTFDPTNYPGIQYLTQTQYNAGGSALVGNYYVRDDGTGPLELSARQVGGSVTLVVEPRIVQNNNSRFFPSTGMGGATVQLISLNASMDPDLPAVEVSNQFDVPSPPPAVLVYSVGYCKFKNSMVENGSVYCGGMDIKNGIDTKFDQRITSVLGFGGAKLTKTKFVEKKPPRA